MTDRGSDAVLVVLTKLSESVISIPTNKNVTSEDASRLLVALDSSKHGVPSKLSYDCDPMLTGNHWRALVESKGITISIATIAHLQTNGQSERSIQTLIAMLHPVIQSNRNM